MRPLYLNISETQNDKQLIEQIYRVYLRKMRQAAFNVLHDEKLAEDAVHESFIKIIKAPEKLREVAKERWASWLVVLAANTAKDMLRKEVKAGMPVDEDFWKQQPAPGRVEARSLLLNEIKCLSEKYRQTLVFYYVFGYDITEIANALEISPDNVRQRLSRARKMLRDILENNF